MAAGAAPNTRSNERQVTERETVFSVSQKLNKHHISTANLRGHNIYTLLTFYYFTYKVVQGLLHQKCGNLVYHN